MPASPPSTGCSRTRGLDAVLATKDASIAYLTGFWGLQLERFFGVAVKRGGERRADRPVARPRQRRHAAPTGLDKALYDAGAVQRAAELFATLDGAKRIGVEEDHLNFARSKALAEAGYELVPATDLVMQLRAAKDAEEVAAVRRACAHIEAVYDELWADLKVGDERGRGQRRASPISLARRGGDAPRAAHPLRRPRRRPARLARRAHAAGRRRRSSPTSPRSSTATGAT